MRIEQMDSLKGKSDTKCLITFRKLFRLQSRMYWSEEVFKAAHWKNDLRKCVELLQIFTMPFFMKIIEENV